MAKSRRTSIILATLSSVLLGSASVQAGNVSNPQEAMEAPPSQRLSLAQVAKDGPHNEHLPGNRTVFGKVEAVMSDQIKVDIGEVQPRFLPLQQAKDKHFPAIKSGDDLIITVNEQNLIVDYHPLEGPSSHHKIIRGTIAGNMPIGHDVVVIAGADGKEQSFKVRSQVRSKVASIPIGTQAIFLLDETDKVADVTFASVSAAKQAVRDMENKSPLKGANRQVDGTVSEPLRADRITVKTGDGDYSFKVRDIMRDKLSGLRKGDSVILLIDNEDKVVDLAVPPQ